MTTEDADARLSMRLAARTAHDLNNIAAVISGHIYLLRNSAEPAEEGFEAMEKAMQHVERLTASLMAIGTLGLEPVESFDVNNAVREAVLASGMAKTIELDLGMDIPPRTGRQADLRRAIEALLANAREANAAGGPIHVATLRDADGGIAITVDDAGQGIPAEVRRRNFEPLYSTKGLKGRGIGIALASAAASLSGGSLALEERLEGGTRAKIRLPAANQL